MEATSIFQAPLTVKAGLNDDLRRFSFTGDFAALRKEIATCFQLAGDFALKYNDDEGDSITLANDRDLTEARQVCGVLLKLKVVKLAVAPVTATLNPSPVVIFEKHNEEIDNKKKAKQEFREAKEKFKAQKHLEKEQLKALKKEAKCEKKHDKSEKKHEHRKHDKCPKSLKEKFEARFVKDVTIEDGSEVQAGASFVKTWRFRNEGTRAWPAGSKLIYVSKEKGDKMGGPDEVPASATEAGAETDISVPFVAPQEPGRYVGFWRLITPEGNKFGQRVRVLIYVPASSSESDGATPRAVARKAKEDVPATEHLAVLEQLKAMGFDDQKRNLKLVRRLNGDLTAVVAKLVRKQKKHDKSLKKSDDM